MVLPRSVAHFNRHVTNPITRRFAAWMPTFAIVTHVGCKTGQRYQTPVNVFQRPGGKYVFALTYGPGALWVRNVLAAGTCEVVTSGRQLTLVEPRLYEDRSQRTTPVPHRWLLHVLGVSQFLEMRSA